MTCETFENVIINKNIFNEIDKSNQNLLHFQGHQIPVFSQYDIYKSSLHLKKKNSNYRIC